MTIRRPTGARADSVPSRRAVARVLGFIVAAESRTAPVSRRIVAESCGLSTAGEPADVECRSGEVVQGVNLALSIKTVRRLGGSGARTIGWQEPSWRLPTRYRVERRFAPTGSPVPTWTLLAAQQDAITYTDVELGTGTAAYRVTPITTPGELSPWRSS